MTPIPERPLERIVAWRVRSWAALTLVLLVGCKGCDDEPPPPPDPPPIECESPQLTPITSVHEHIAEAPKCVEVLLEVADRVGVQKVNLLPFLNENVDAQNLAQMEAARAQPERVSSFVTIDTLDETAVGKLEELLAKGATGVKLYSGHKDYYAEGAILGDTARRVYRLIEAKGLPVLLHLNAQRFEKELRVVLDDYPELVVLCPHYCLLSTKPGRLHKLLSDYPRLYVDVSFGAPLIALSGMMGLSDRAEVMRAVVRTHRHQIVFGMDLTIPVHATDADALAKWAQPYRDVLEKKNFTFLRKELKGMHLDDCTLESIYHVNPERFLAGKAPLVDDP